MAANYLSLAQPVNYWPVDYWPEFGLLQAFIPPVISAVGRITRLMTDTGSVVREVSRVGEVVIILSEEAKWYG